VPGKQLIPDMQWHLKKEVQFIEIHVCLCAGPGPLSEIEGVMKQEYALAVRMCGRGDFAEGKFHTQESVLLKNTTDVRYHMAFCTYI
jgi:hypothetical protein